MGTDRVSQVHKKNRPFCVIFKNNAYLCGMNIPKAVMREASETLELLGGTVVYLGKINDGREAYLHKPAIDGCTGFPFVYLYDGRTAMEITGFDALDIINDFVEE